MAVAGAPEGNMLGEHYYFRRQFVLGPRRFSPTTAWRTLSFGRDLTVSVHPDLEVASHESPHGGLILLGFFVDPLRPELTSAQILDDIGARAQSFADVLQLAEPLTGRWVLLFRSPAETAILHDPCGLRQVYFHQDAAGQLWCGSQPAIIAACTPLEPNEDPELRSFVASRAFRRTEENWIGDKTQYAHCFRLLPNHYYSVDQRRAIRFFPGSALPRLTVQEAVRLSVPLLSGCFTALVRRHRLALAVTAGWDSRVLLAAARQHLPQIECFVDKKGVLADNHPDVRIPLALSKRLGFKFEVRNSANPPGEDFLRLLRFNVTGARLLPKIRMISSKLERKDTSLYVNGNGSEICRTFYEHGGPPLSTARPGDLAYACGYSSVRFARQEIEAWMAPVRFEDCRVRPLDLLYWEQRMGTWGAQFPSEQDIAVDEVSPFNNRRLITILLSTDVTARRGPDYPLYHALLEALWPEALSVPINPAPALLRLTRAIRRHLADPLMMRLSRLQRLST